MSYAIQNLMSLGAVTECLPSPDQFLSQIFLASKPNGGKRFILNLKALNKFITTSHFKMEDHRTASKLIPKGGFLATIDLKEAYLLVPIIESQRKYLRFQFENNDSRVVTYEFTAMPYGLSVAPRVFTKIMREVITFLRSRGFASVIYLDDILCIGNSYKECKDNVNETIKLLTCLGFVINCDKSCLEPKQSCKFLGFIFNTIDLTLSLPVDKQNKIALLVNKFLSLPRCTIREFAQLIGVLTAACPAVQYGWLYTKILEREKYSLLLRFDTYETKVSLSDKIFDDLIWWSNNISFSSNQMRVLHYDKVIYTDACTTGWGAVCGKERVNGHWKDSERGFHINYLELLAIYLGLKTLAKNLNNCAILLRVDNTTALSYINRMGGIQYPHLNDLTRQIWHWCEKRHIWLFASYINTKDNVEADVESRRINPDIEWELSNHAFQTIIAKLGQPQIDLFASRTNAKCQKYISWKQDPDACSESPSSVQKPYPGCREVLRIAFDRQGTPGPAVDLMVASLADNTIKQYSSSLKRWWSFCMTNQINFFDCSIKDVITFLSEQFHNGASYGTINCHRSALSILLGKMNIGLDESVKRLLKGVYKLRPTTPKYNTTWDPKLVLNFVSKLVPHQDISLENLTKKLVSLLALCTAHRVQTLSLIKVNNIQFSSSGAKITITDLIKTSGPNRDQPVLYLPFFNEDTRICPATTLQDYLKATNNVRDNKISNLFITNKRPYKAATAQTISKWLKMVLSESGVDVTMFSAHSTRHAATSAARAAGVAVDVIRKTATWTSSSLTFARFYNRPVIDDSEFARSVCFANKT
ncbi:hypothetical protein MSG28_010630 [Choristoneura fumiferana]|uniref:Uncharacterized protein n=1 Tax=Choristoneura fumiferana TaxID=7141 RepID=A0ACC0KNE0_CHOFU|nr:hypothetical protein MSG28_010630 [Choristoneura fumiferana]